MRRIALSFLTVIMILSLATPTRSIYAVPESVIGGAAQAAIDAAISGASAVPAVPTTDTVQATKEVKLCMWGVCIPGLDKIAITMVKQVLERMVDSTVEWINNGFDGNPAYVTDPKQYFTDLADGVAGEFIGDVTSQGTPLDFLCSPFKAQIKLSLRTQYTKSDQFQCTLTGIVGNIDSFYNDFSQGGWDAWFSMTQNSDNNPYGAYLGAKIELDSRLAAAIGLEGKQLDWGKGFLSYQPCVVHEDVYSFPENGGAPTRTTGKCLVKGPIQTPGTAIEDGLSHVLGTGVRQLELADEFDELVGALVARALQDTVLGATGLFNAKKVSSEPTPVPVVPTLPTEPVCPIPEGPRSLCENVDRDTVMEIVNRYRPSNAGITAAIIEINTIYPDARVLEHPVRLDKIDFGGGLIVDIIVGAVGGTPDAEGTGWAWMQECDCGGPVEVIPPDQTP